jgi:hypothetical protein
MPPSHDHLAVAKLDDIAGRHLVGPPAADPEPASQPRPADQQRRYDRRLAGNPVRPLR